MIQVMVRPRFEGMVSTGEIQRIADAALEMEADVAQETLSIVITGDDEIQALNHQFRGIDAPTDVLSFAEEPADLPFVIAPEEPPYLGDVIISFDRAQAQAAERALGVDEELRLLIVHGVLHLLGYDHATPEEKRQMWARQDAVLDALRGQDSE